MNISEIAKLAGVSVSAVSRYLNNGYVSEDKKRLIREVIERTGYQPSQQARILRTKRSKVIGVIVPKISSEAIGRIVSGVHEVLAEQGYQMLLADTRNDPGKEIDYLNLLNKNPVDGIVFVATVFENRHKITLEKLDVPVVIIGQEYEGVPCVFHDDYQSAKEMTAQMIADGRSKIGILSVTESDRAAGYQRLAGYRKAHEEAAVAYDQKLTEECEFSMESGYEGMKNLLKREPDTDGVFCVTDAIAIGAIEYLKDEGIHIPGQVAVAGVGYSQMARVITPRLTTIHLHYKTSGIEGTKMLIEMIEGDSRFTRQLKLGYEIIEAETI